MKIVVPSYKRAGMMETTKWLPMATVVVPESQLKEYQDKNPFVIDIVGIPDAKDGSISKKRNAVLELFQGEDILMLDDDIREVGYFEGEMMNRVSGEYFVEFVKNMFVMCEEVGTILWGVNVQSDKKFYREYSPFSLSSIILGPFFGIRNVDKELRFSEELTNKEDYDFAIEVLRKYRKILRNNKWYYMCGHITNEGGIVGMRNWDDEWNKAILLQKKWGSKIVDFKRKTQGGNTTINPIIRSPIKGI